MNADAKTKESLDQKLIQEIEAYKALTTENDFIKQNKDIIDSYIEAGDYNEVYAWLHTDVDTYN
jgi:hypothetical protein